MHGIREASDGEPLSRPRWFAGAARVVIVAGLVVGCASPSETDAAVDALRVEQAIDGEDVDAGTDDSSAVRMDTAVRTDVGASLTDTARVDAPGICSAVVNDAPPTTTTTSTGTPPVGHGGTIRPGHYHLQSWTWYSRMAVPALTFRLSVDIGTTSFDSVAEGSTGTNRQSSTMLIDGANATFTQSCPAAAVWTDTFEASTTSLTFITRAVDSSLAFVRVFVPG